MKKLFITAAILLTGLATAAQNHSQTLNLSTMTSGITREKVRFNSDGPVLAAYLYLPAGFNPQQKYPAVVAGGSLTSVKEQMAGAYARQLAEKGFIALAIDYRNYGESEGLPRQYEDPALKLKDLQAAVTYLLSLPYVKAVGALGICTSGGNVAYLAAEDKRIKAAAVVASHLPDAAILPVFYGGPERVQALRTAGAAAKRQFALTGENRIIPAYSNTDTTASHVGPMEYYMDTARGGGVKEWRNEFAVMSWETWLDFDPIGKAEHITAPLIMFHSDKCALPDNARKFYAAVKSKKQLVWGTGDHFDYYDKPEQITAVVNEMSRFFTAHLQ